MKLGIEELSIIVEGLRLRVKQLSSSVTEINQSIENLETEDGTKAPAIMQTTSPAGIASFSDGAEDMPIKSLKCTIVPVQAGTGDPAPDNVRPITGWDGVTVTRTGTDPADTVSQSVNFPQTVYGGWVDVIKGKLHVTHGRIDLGSIDWNLTTVTDHERFACKKSINDLKGAPSASVANGVCEMFKMVSNNSTYGHLYNNSISLGAGYIYVYSTNYETVEAFKTAMSGVYLVYELTEETIIDLDPVTITTLLGNNNIYCNTGNVEVEYAADTKMYIDNAVSSVTPEPEPSPEQDDAPPEEEEEEEAEPAPEEDIAEPEEAAEEEEAVPVVKKASRKK